MGQSFLYDFEEDEEGECDHDDEDTREYVLSGKHFDGNRERRVYCRGCRTVIERERLPLDATPDGGGRV